MESVIYLIDLRSPDREYKDVRNWIGKSHPHVPVMILGNYSDNFEGNDKFQDFLQVGIPLWMFLFCDSNLG